MRAIQITEFGGPETLVVSERPRPGRRRRASASSTWSRPGVNYADTHQTED